ncbi:MAG: bifunctional folylpolyglutamate synthase/dihydrofolate synthase [Actinomycetota bacterium]
MSQELEDDHYWAMKAEVVLEKLLQRIPENKIRPRLDPTKRAVNLLGDPQKSYQVIHITGTNGKTSTTRFIERILREHGIRTGRFTSPHLLKLNERIAIDGEPVSDETLFRIFSDIEPVLEFVDQELEEAGESRLTFFEALAVLGFAIFADAPVEVLVLEVGMGGLWDSTNVADGDVAVFTPIGLDHMDRLGNTIEEIAQTKSGIIKPGAFVVSSKQDADAEKVIQQVSQSIADSLKLANQDFSVISTTPSAGGQNVKIRGLAGEYGPYEMPIFGSHQSENLSVAIAAVESFFGVRELSDDILRSAVADLSSPGRLQWISAHPPLILDGAHNPAGAEVLARELKDRFGDRPLVGVLAVLAEKDAAGLISKCHGLFENLILTSSSSPRSLRSIELEEIAKSVYVTASAIENFPEALKKAREIAISLGGVVVITGSISLVGDALQVLQEESNA